MKKIDGLKTIHLLESTRMFQRELELKEWRERIRQQG